MSNPISLVNYHIAQPGIPLPPMPARLYEYILAGNGVFIRGARREFTAQFCIAPCEVRGLTELENQIRLQVPRVSAAYAQWMLQAARAAQDDHGRPVEVVFHLWLDADMQWQVVKPAQTQHPTRTQPIDDSATSSYARALVELHSHVHMAARFSGFDDEDEQGFRLFAVLGRIFDQPELRVRVGMYGYRCEIPARLIFELPPEVRDCVAAETDVV